MVELFDEARTADFAVRVFSVALIATVPCSIAASKLRPVPSGTGLRRPFLSHRYFFIVVSLLSRREKFTEPDFALSARAFNGVSMGLWPIRGHENHLVTPAKAGVHVKLRGGFPLSWE